MPDQKPGEKREGNSQENEERPGEHDRGWQNHFVRAADLGAGREYRLGLDLDGGHECPRFAGYGRRSCRSERGLARFGAGANRLDSSDGVRSGSRFSTGDAAGVSLAGCGISAGAAGGDGSRVMLSNTSASTLRSSGRSSATSGGIAPAISARNVGISVCLIGMSRHSTWPFQHAGAGLPYPFPLSTPARQPVSAAPPCSGDRPPLTLPAMEPRREAGYSDNSEI